MSLATINAPFERTGRGQLYLAAYPSADPGATTSLVDEVEGFFGIFYTDGLERKTLKAGVKPWANIDSNGLKVKVKQNVVEYNPNAGSKHPVAIEDTAVSAEITFADVDPAHLADAMSLSAAELLAQAAAVGKAGRAVAILGGQTNLNKYVAMYRMPSILTPGEYDHYLFPRITFNVDAEFDLSKAKVLTCKLMMAAQPDLYIINADGFGEMAFADIANAPAT
ncbi:MAG: hypothetical protein JSS67_03625 [Bacteroidetes bacterium]|nr:hypothetical protein [Bacteroidota bacterium]